MDTQFFGIPFAKDGDKIAVPIPAQGDGSVSWDIGYGVDYALDPTVDPDAILIERRKFNQILFAITSSLARVQEDFPQWITSSDNAGSPYAYNKGAVVRYTDGNLYQSTTAANITTPTVDPSWVVFLSTYATIVALNAEVTRATNAEALLAPINSPVFTGAPQAPTQTAGDVSSRLATTAFVAGAVAAEAARAMAAEALLAPIASPSFTGSPTAPTPAPGDNDTSIATSAFVTAAVLVERNRALAAEALLAPLNNPAFTGVPTTPTPPPTSSDATVPNTAWVRGLLGGAFNPSVPGSFSYGGFIFKWAVGGYDPADNSEPAYTISWDAPFPNAIFCAVVSCDLAGPTGNMDSWYQTFGWGTSGVNVQRQRPANGSWSVPTRAVVFGVGR